jgi:hypothetical protein
VADPRRQFRLPSTDENYLNGLGTPWETVAEGQSQWLLIHDWKVPDGYNVERVMLALLIHPNYSDEQIDMFFLYPQVSRRDGGAIKQLIDQQIDGKTYQRWSRHRTAQNPWRPGIDDVSSHLTLVVDWLTRDAQ